MVSLREPAKVRETRRRFSALSTLANLSPAEEAMSKDEVELEKFLQAQKSKTVNIRLRAT